LDRHSPPPNIYGVFWPAEVDQKKD